MSQLNKGHRIKVEMEVTLPETASYEEIQDWLAFETGGGSIAGDNPLNGHDLEAENLEFEDTGVYHSFEVVDLTLDPETGGAQYRMRRHVHRDTRTAEEAEAWQSDSQASRAAIAAARADTEVAE